MFQQVKAAAGIHMSTFKEKGKVESSQDPESEGDPDLEVNAANWTAPPSFLADLRRNDVAAGVTK